jgi:hypothetical protein
MSSGQPVCVPIQNLNLRNKDGQRNGAMTDRLFAETLPIFVFDRSESRAPFYERLGQKAWRASGTQHDWNHPHST